MADLPPFQTLIDEHDAAVMAVLRGAVGREGAEDAFQETFLAALRAYPSLRDARNLRGWLVTICHRQAIDHPRARGGGGRLSGGLPRRPPPLPEPARRPQPARPAGDDRPPQGDRPPPGARAGAGAGPRGARGGVHRSRPRRRSDLGSRRRPAAQTARGGDPAIRLGPPPRGDRGGARLFTGRGPPEPARGTETTAKGARMNTNI